MGVKNFPLYKVTEHARTRAQTRFNIAKSEMDTWMTRLLSQAVYVETTKPHREKYRLNDIVVIVDPVQKMVVTVYSENEHDDFAVATHTNPEVKSVINHVLGTMIKQKRVKTAIKVHNSIEKMVAANNRMIKPYTNYRYSDSAWEDLLDAFEEAEEVLKSSLVVINEARAKIQEG